MSPPELLHCQGGGGVYLFRYIANRSQHPQYIKKAIVVVLALDWAASVSFWQFLEHLGGDELGAEERRCRVGDGRLEGHCEFVESGCGCQRVLGVGGRDCAGN